MKDDLDRASSLFLELCDLPLEQQARRLREVLEVDPELGVRVSQLLHADRSPDARLEGCAVDLMTQPPSEQVGQEVLAWMERLSQRKRPTDQYQVRAEIGSGGMGTVFEVWDADMERTLALKRIGSPGSEAPGRSIDPGRAARFLSEARITGQLDHPGIVPVHDIGIDDQGRPYFTMKRVEGRTLTEVFELVHVGKEGWTLARAIGVFLRLCETLAFAHSRGVIHRDLKPSNVMVGRFGEVYVMDWGIAKVVGARDGGQAAREEPILPGSSSTSRPITLEGRVLGTLAYMAPEQASGRHAEVGPHSDIYSIGAMLYELLARSAPYRNLADGRSPSGTPRIDRDPPAPIRSLAPRAPEELKAICEHAMAPDWRARYRDVGELGEDLSAYLESRPGLAWADGAFRRAVKLTRRHPAAATALAAAVVVVLTSASGLLLYSQEKKRADAERDLAFALRLEGSVGSVLLNDVERLSDDAILAGCRRVLGLWREAGVELDGEETPDQLVERFSKIRSRSSDAYTTVVKQIESLAYLLERPQLYCVMLFCEGRFPREVSARRRPLWQRWCEEYPDVLQFVPRIDEILDGITEDPWRRDVWTAFRARMRDKAAWPDQILSKTPDSASDQFFLATRLAGDPDMAVRMRAAELFELFLASGAEEHEAHFLLGYWKFGHIPELLDNTAAIDHFYSAAMLKPNSFRNLSNLGAALLNGNRNEEALRALERAAGIQSADAGVQLNLGEALRRAKRLEEALVHFNESIRLDPSYPSPYFNRGLTLVLLGDCTRAEPDLRKVVELDPGHAKAWAQLGSVLEKQGRDDEALEAFDKALELQPDAVDWVNQRETVLRRMEAR